MAPPEVTIQDIYNKGVIPFISMQFLALLLFFYPQIALWLPKAIGW